MMYEELVRSLKTEFGDIPDEDICDCEMCMMRKYAKDGDYTECVQRLGKAALDAIEDLQKQRDEWESHATLAEILATNPWIPVAERLPEDRQRVLAFYMLTTNPPTPWCKILYFSTNLESVCEYEFEGENHAGFYECDSEWGFYEKTGITHWMPLPEPPKEKEA